MSIQEFMGMRIMESAHAISPPLPVRLYPKRKAKSAIHHRRMTKKWLKRYGTHCEPRMYVMSTAALQFPTMEGGARHEIIVAHPTLVAALKSRLTADFEKLEREFIHASRAAPRFSYSGDFKGTFNAQA